MTKFTADSKNRLLELLEEKLKLFGTVREYTERHAKLIAEDSFEALLSSTQDRQDAITKINGLHQESNVLMQSYMSFVNSGGKKIPEIESADQRLTDIMSECAGLNEKNMKTLKEKMKDQSEKSEKMRQSRESLGLYAQGGSNSAELFDELR